MTSMKSLKHNGHIFLGRFIFADFTKEKRFAHLKTF